MKKNFFYKVMMVMAFFALTENVGAQSVVNGDTLTVSQITEYLTCNPNDTVKVFVKETQNGDSLNIVHRLYYREGDKYKTRQHTHTKMKNREAIHQLYKASVQTRFEENLYSSRHRDVWYYQVEGIPGVMGADRHRGKIVARAANKYGWGFDFFAGYQFAEHIIAPLGGLGVKFDQPVWMVSLSAELGQSKTSATAQVPGEKYLTSRTELGLGFQPFRFDKYNQNRLFVGAKLGWEWYKTDSPADEYGNYFRSEGNYLYPSVFARYERRMFTTGNSWFIEASCSRKQYVTQETWRDGVMIQSGVTKPMISVELKLGFELGFGRDKIKNKSYWEMNKKPASMKHGSYSNSNLIGFPTDLLRMPR